MILVCLVNSYLRKVQCIFEPHQCRLRKFRCPVETVKRHEVYGKRTRVAGMFRIVAADVNCKGLLPRGGLATPPEYTSSPVNKRLVCWEDPRRAVKVKMDYGCDEGKPP